MNLDNADAVEMIGQGRGGEIGFVMESHSAEYLAKNKCNLYTVGKLSERPMGLAFRKGKNLRSSIHFREYRSNSNHFRGYKNGAVFQSHFEASCSWNSEQTEDEMDGKQCLLRNGKLLQQVCYDSRIGQSSRLIYISGNNDCRVRPCSPARALLGSSKI